MTLADSYQFFLQLFLAFALGALIGLEREIQGKAAGLRTYSLVTLGACLFTIISVFGFEHLGVNLQNFDPTRIAGQVVVGIGFIGAGLIFLRGDSVQGLTTAAGLWISAAIGVAVGVKFYWVAVFTTFLALVVLVVLRWFEKYIQPQKPPEQP